MADPVEAHDDFTNWTLEERTFHLLTDGEPVSILNCPRCHDGRHDNVPCVAFARPVVDSDGVWTHWQTCPTTGDPVMSSRPDLVSLRAQARSAKRQPEAV